MSNEIEKKSDELLVEEFEIVELEDRLELEGRCNWGCGADIDVM